MEQQELAVRWSPGRLPRKGTVIERPTAKATLVEWDDGEKETVKSTDKSVRYALNDSKRAEWLLEPGLVDDEFQADPVSVLTNVVKDAGSITTTNIKKQLGTLGIDQEEVARLLSSAKGELASHDHIAVKGATYSWSTEPIVRPLDYIKTITPLEALDRLQTTLKFKPGEKAALFDAVRNALAA